MSEAAVKTSPLQGLSSSVKSTLSNSTPAITCRQVIWFSFFFDGTGNNLNADEGMSKHSNIAKLFRAHKKTDKINGTYPLYIPGVGTYFAEIGDDGGSALGLGCGAKGGERLDYALTKFDELIKPHLGRANAPSHAITEVNIAVFGFSRGAALARAFLNLLLKKRCRKRGERWTLNDGAWPVRLRFMGLFDTVASVGLPMSTNTTSIAGAATSSASYMIGSRLMDYPRTRPEALAFVRNAAPGADPAPGLHDGHDDWGGQLQIDDTVEEVRHFVAAHEIRNSFPVDSVSVYRDGRVSKSDNFHETVYPGVHSDVGGSYAPGEGGKGDDPSEKLGLIPLKHMYHYAVRKGVPLSPESAWLPINISDFDTDPDLVKIYDEYLKKIGKPGTLGQTINKNMELYFAWRFRSIKLKMSGNRSEADRISFNNAYFKKQEVSIDREIAALSGNEKRAQDGLNVLLSRRAAEASRLPGMPGSAALSISLDQQIEAAQNKHQMARDELLKAKARKDALPNMENLQTMLDLYDKQLLADVRAIRDVFVKPGLFGSAPETARRAELRPHYRLVLEAYENEFERNQGLKDESVFNFFENYVHDSLAAFAKDATLPSDPRVVYLGEDQKYEYADVTHLQNHESEIT
jgi:hypothetical protein